MPTEIQVVVDELINLGAAHVILQDRYRDLETQVNYLLQQHAELEESSSNSCTLI